jgi:hypothetical protein
VIIKVKQSATSKPILFAGIAQEVRVEVEDGWVEVTVEDGRLQINGRNIDVTRGGTA